MPPYQYEFNDEDAEIACNMYLNADVPLDKLPYTQQFERMLTTFARKADMTLTLGEFYRAYLKLRNAGKLPKLRSP